MVDIIPIDVYLIFKKLNRNIKMSDIAILNFNEERGSILYKANNIVLKPEQNNFLKNYYPSIKKLCSIDSTYISNYNNIKDINPNIFYYDYTEGNKLCDFVYDYGFKFINKKEIIKNIVKFIKFYINIDTSIFGSMIETSEVDHDIINFRKKLISNNSFNKNLIQIYDTCIKKQKKSNKTLLLLNDLNAHNIIISENNNVKLIDMSEGIIIGNYNLFIHRYFSLLWLFGEKVVDKAIKDCSINNENLLLKELSFFYFYNYQLHVFDLNSPIERFECLLFKYKCSKICKKIIKSFNKR